MKHLILGGARSGKSRFAENKALALGASPYYIATATADDDEMGERISNHKISRGECWKTIEEPIYLGKLLHDLCDPNNVILIDCMTLWLSNCLHKNVFKEEKRAFVESLKACSASVIIVSNEVGSGIVPLGKLSRDFVDESGWLNQELAVVSDQVTLVVAGLPMTLKSGA
ncbi:MAG: bifunctional adenosylcobinamide kinase/adenosylcobinamide-phosphate guanylyltransferase [Agarilytica sp.]